MTDDDKWVKWMFGIATAATVVFWTCLIILAFYLVGRL